MAAVVDYAELNTSDSELLDRHQILQEAENETRLNLTPEKQPRELEGDSPDRLLSSPEDRTNFSSTVSDSLNINVLNNEEMRSLSNEPPTLSSIFLGIAITFYQKIKLFVKYLDLYLFLQNIPMLLLCALRLISYKLMFIYFVCSSVFVFHRFRLRCMRAYEESTSGNGNSSSSNEDLYLADDQQSHSDILPSQNQVGNNSNPQDQAAQQELDALDEYNEERLRNLYIGLRILSAMGVAREGERRTRSGSRANRGIILREPPHQRGYAINDLTADPGHNSFQPFLDSILRGFSYNSSAPGHSSYGRPTSQRGLSERQVNNLLSYKYSKKDWATPEESEERQCIICFEDFEMDQDVKSLPCIHTYHKNCIDKWLRAHNSCPVCKSKII